MDNEIVATETETAEVKKHPQEASNSRPRNYSHMDRNPDSMDEVEGPNGKTYKIPATIGSNYWGVLRCMYAHADEPVLVEDLVKEVNEIMMEHDEERWSVFCGKAKTTVWKRAKKEREVQQTKPWQDRVVNNAKTLTRWKDYGKRLHERGHVMRFEYDDQKRPYFILRTSLDCIKAKSK